MGFLVSEEERTIEGDFLVEFQFSVEGVLGYHLTCGALNIEEKHCWNVVEDTEFLEEKEFILVSLETGNTNETHPQLQIEEQLEGESLHLAGGSDLKRDLVESSVVVPVFFGDL